MEGQGQAVDCALCKARFGEIRQDATPRTGARRAANGACWLMGGGGPPRVAAAGVNVHDAKPLSMTWEDVSVERTLA